jgi:MinD-like ATPase involved in chromosome partitioning or flagellar assembly
MIGEPVGSAGDRRREVITFYSYKGGTGRSMLLANVAWLLASTGCKVLLIDWDLEAPGLHRYFKPFLGEDTELRSQKGIMEWVTDYWDAYLDHPDADLEALIRDFADPRHYVRKLETGTFIADGGIDLLCAGRQDGFYAQAVADFDWTRLWGSLRGDEFIDIAKGILIGPGGYDYVLVDSRTGVSDTSGFCTVALADTLVVCFSYNNQSVIGASQISRNIRRQAEKRRESKLREGLARRFRLFAVPSRVEDLDPERLERRQKHAWGLFSDLLTDVSPRQQADYWVGVQVRNQPLFAYEEVLAACMNRPTDPQSVLGSVAQVARWLTDDAFKEVPALSDDQRAELRDRFADVSGAAAPLVDREAWELFVEHMPDPDGRESILHACFGLLVQLVGTATSSQQTLPGHSELPFVRMMALEADFTEAERRMAEILTSMYVTQRRITDGRTRGLMLRDDSILRNWSGLQDQLKKNLDFIDAREQIQQSRQSWEAGGQSLASLQGFDSNFLNIQFTDQNRAWLGKRNLQFYEVAQELRSWRERESATTNTATVRTKYLLVATVMVFVLSVGLLWQYRRNQVLMSANVTLGYRADVAKAWALMRKKSFFDAETAFGRLVEVLPEDPSPLQGRALARAQLNDPQGAATDLSRAIELMNAKFEQVDASNYYFLGTYYKGANDTAAAKESFARYLQTARLSGASAFEQLYLHDAEWELNGGLQRKTDLSGELSSAWTLNQQGNFADAELHFDSLLRDSEGNISAYLGRYYAREQQKKPGASNDIKSAIERMMVSGGKCEADKRRDGLVGSARY